MIVNKYNNGGGGSISGGSADYATLAGESDKSKLLEGASAPPQSANTGDVVAIAPNPTRGLRSARTLGIYQYDGTNWNKIEGEGSSAYKIELTEVNPQYYTEQDRVTLIDFYTAFTADTSIADSAYISALNGIYRCVRYVAIPNSPIFTFEGSFNDNIVDIWLNFSDGRFSYGSLQNAVPTTPSPESTSLKPAADFPENPVEGEVMIRSEETLIDYRPEAPNGQTVYGGNLEEFMVTLKGTSNNELWVKTWDDAGHTERTDQGYFHLESDAIDYYDYQGDMDYLFNDLNEGEWVDVNTICLWKEGNNLYFYVKQEAEGVFFPDTQETMVFDTMAFENLVNQYDNGEWRIFPSLLYSSWDFPKTAVFGDVVGLGKTEDREATSADVFTSATVTMVNGRATFKMYNPNYSGYCEDYTFGYDVNEGIIGSWGGENNVINGPWNDQGVEFTIDGDDITFTTQNPENTSEALQMWGFDPNCNDRIVVKELGIYQRDEEGWNRAVMSNSINSIVKLTQAEYDALVSGGTVDENTFYLIVADQPQPQAIGVWSDDGNGTYTFQMLDTDPASWDNAAQIGQLLGVNWPDAGSDPIDMNVYLRDNSGSWEITTNYTGGGVSDEPHYDFTDGTQDEWDTGIRTSEASSESNITVSWDGTDTFTFYSADSDYPLSMTTIDPTAE